VDDWAKDGLLLIGDAAHTMSPAGAIGVNVALATAAVAAQELYPRLGRGPILRAELQGVQRQREADIRTLHRLQLRAQQVLVRREGSGAMSKWLVPKILPLVLQSPLMPLVQRRIFFGAPLPKLDPAFTFPKLRQIGPDDTTCVAAWS
jgi:2-polyprenyl-6-methoxyphenol hydroxylase-like FAD-dependent oxidoreductase